MPTPFTRTLRANRFVHRPTCPADTTQEYLTLARKAQENPTEAAWRGEQGDINPAHHSPGIALDNSLESLLRRSEFHTDQALAWGSVLPLAMLVKGQVLVFRGQFQVRPLP